MNKEDYIKYANETFQGDALELVSNQIELFFAPNKNTSKNKCNLNDDVILKKGTFLHGIRSNLEQFDWIIDMNGFISSDFSRIETKNKFFNTIGMWHIQNDCKLSDYIKLYSGVTIGYTMSRGPGFEKITKLIPYKEFEIEIESHKNDDHWMWWAEQTKEIRFMPSLASDRAQLAFILNMDSDYAKSFLKGDIFSYKMTNDILKYFVVEPLLFRFLDEERDDFTTTRESAIMFGLPLNLVEGIFVGRLLEQDKKLLKHIKKRLPDCYICNLDGKVIIE